MSKRHCDTFNNHILKYQLSNPDKYLIIDSDMFLIDYFDHEEYFKHECAIVLQSRGNINYIWPGLCYLDFTRITNTNLLNWNCAPGLDSGGMMKDWLKLQTSESNSNDKVYFIKHLSSCSWSKPEIPQNLLNEKLIEFLETDPRNTPNYFCEIYDNKFFHYRAGGNWNGEGMNLHKLLTKKLKLVFME